MLALFCQECEHWDRENMNFGNECSDCKEFSKYKIHIPPYKTTSATVKVTHSDFSAFEKNNRIDFK